MADKNLHLQLCSPTHPAVNCDSSEVILPGTAGILTILPGHTPLLTTLGKGVIIAFEENASPRYFAVHDGFAEVLDNRILVLADIMEPAENIDAARAQAASERAKERLRKPAEDIDMARVEAALARSLARIEAHADHIA